MEFQFGTNWAAFSTKAGSVIGQPLAMEGLFAFFFESVFLGVLLYGRNRVRRVLHTFSGFAVCAGAWLSGFFVVATDAWMQHPVGYALAADGRIELTSIAALLASPFALWQYAHMLAAALLAGGTIVAGIGAFYVLADRDVVHGKAFLRAGVATAFAFALLVVFPTGDRNGANVTEYQPVKLAAMEGLFESTRDAPLAIIGMPDVKRRTLIDPIFVPDLLSFLAYGNFRANVEGLTAYARELWPPVELTYYAYHVMVGLGTIFLAVTAVAVLLLRLGRLFATKTVLWLLMLDDAVSVHRQRSGLGRRRSRPAAVDHLRPHANERRRLAQRRDRRDDLHADRIRRHLSRPRFALRRPHRCTKSRTDLRAAR